MKRFFFSLAFMTVGFVVEAQPGHGSATDLVFANGAIYAHATWTKGPQSPDESILQIEWKNGVDHSPMEPPGTFKTVLWMPDTGHGSAPTKVQRVLDQHGQALVGVYQVSNIYFVMVGKWEIKVTLKLSDGSSQTKTFEVNLDGNNGHHH